MKINQFVIDVGFDNLESILHTADIHIRNLRRHTEYEEAFEKLYALAEKLPKNSIIYIGGDIAHTKTQMSPELIRMISDFLKKLADIRPTFFILGNHDLNLNNQNRLDALSPIIDNLKHPNLHFLKESGIYTIADAEFAVMSVFDNPENFIKATDLSSDTKIALYHGIAENAKTDFDFTLPGDIKLSTFDNYDMVLLGDIHKHQYMNIGKTIAYCGSLIQQNHGEDSHKGVLVWNVPDRKSKFIEIKNDYGFYTLDIDNGVVPDIQDIPKNATLRVRTTNTEPSELKLAIAKVRSKYKVKNLTITKMDTLAKQKTGEDSLAISIGNITKSEFQYQLIKEYLEKNYGVEDSVLKKIQKINEDLNDQLPSADISRNIIWKLKKFEFENMFSYGTGNLIDFNDMEGIIGVFAPNAAGKSSLLDAISFCLFDTCSRSYKAAHILNNKSENFRCKINFEINGYDYYVERRGEKKTDNTVKVDVDFTMKDETGELISLNGDQRRTTNANIKKIIGTYDDFVMTTLSVQNNFTVFIDKTQKERKELLADFMGIGIFDELHKLAKLEISEVKSVLKSFGDINYDEQLAEHGELLKEYTAEYEKIENDRDKIVIEKEEIDKERKKLSKQLRPIDKSVADISILNSEKDKFTIKLTTLETQSVELDESQKVNVQQYNIIQSNIDKLVAQNVEDKFIKYEKLKQEKDEAKIKVDMLKISVRHKLDKMDKLKDLEYDPNCTFCMNNIFVKDAIETEKEIEKDKQIAKDAVANLIKFEEQVESGKSIINDKDELDKERRNLIENKIASTKLLSEQNLVKAQKVKIDSELLLTEDKITKHHKQKQDVLFNETLEGDIIILDTTIAILDKKITTYNDDMSVAHGNKRVSEVKIESIQETIDKIKTLETEYESYNFYLDAIQRDGVPYELITQALPVVEGEINEILGQVVDFNIRLEMDGKNINTFLVYDEDNVWPLELCGGMEKFISSLAIRIGLINISNLPLSNFLVLDEGFGMLDADNLNSVYMLFQYMKTLFQFVLIVSHVEGMRDSVDLLIDIEKTSGFSKIYHS